MTEAGHGAGSTPGPPSSPSLQPLLHDLASCVAAPGVLLTSADGQLRPGGVSGWYLGDVRLLDRWEVSVAGSDLDLVRADLAGASRHSFSYVARSIGDLTTHDPTVRVDRSRVLHADAVHEEVAVESTAQDPVEVVVRVELGSDLAPMSRVKQGHIGEPVSAREVDGGLAWSSADGEVEVAAEPPADIDPATGGLTWRFTLAMGERRTVTVRAGTTKTSLFGPGRPAGWDVDVGAIDLRVTRSVRQGLSDLEGLLLDDQGDQFLAAGSPWFLTLFGRDSLWAARMLVAADPAIALSTLRVLARRQGRTDDPATEEQPGKILHEVRPGVLDLGRHRLPPLYYGSVDATPLFVCTLADAADWGADPEQVRALLPAARACLEWVLTQSQASGWLTYVDHTGVGLANQGWKDSHDAVPFADGRLAEPPISLVEVQAYAYEAAARGGALLTAFGEEPVPGLAAWADDLRTRFATAFWVDTPDGGHAAIALDREGRRVDSLTSNIGHLLGTGVLEPSASDRLAALLVDPRLDSGFGLRTLASDSPRFARLTYHCGSVWPHDTAIAVRGLAAEGRLEEAARLTRGLVVAAEGFGYRLPELYGGDAADQVGHPAVYPAACRPQAWAAAAPLACLVALTGLRPDPVARTLTHPGRTSDLLGAWSLRGLRLGEDRFDVLVAADGAIGIGLPDESRITVHVT